MVHQQQLKSTRPMKPQPNPQPDPQPSLQHILEIKPENLQPDEPSLAPDDYRVLLAQWGADSAIGTIMALYQLILSIAEAQESRSIAREFLISSHGKIVAKQYLLKYQCDNWVSWHKNTDDLIVNDWELIKKNGKITHNSCLFQWICNSSEECLDFLLGMVGKLQSDVWSDANLLRLGLRMLSKIYTDDRPKSLPIDAECNSKCRPFIYEEGVSPVTGLIADLRKTGEIPSCKQGCRGSQCIAGALVAMLCQDKKECDIKSPEQKSM
jgi:hypothetical protein